MFYVPSWHSGDTVSYADFVYLHSFQHEGRFTLSEEFVRQKLREIPALDTIYLGTATLKAETSVISAAGLAQAVMDRLMEGDTINMTLLASEGGGRYDVDPQAGNWPSQAVSFTQRFDWSYAQDPGDVPAESLLLISPEGNLSLRFWPGRDLVLLNTRRAPQWDTIWLQAEPNGDSADTTDIYGYMRRLYDEAELDGLSKAGGDF